MKWWKVKVHSSEVLELIKIGNFHLSSFLWFHVVQLLGIYLECNVGILMETEDFRLIDKRQLINVRSVLHDGVHVRSVVNAWGGVFIPLFQSVRCKESLENRWETTLIPLVCYSSAVSNLNKRKKSSLLNHIIQVKVKKEALNLNWQSPVHFLMNKYTSRLIFWDNVMWDDEYTISILRS